MRNTESTDLKPNIIDNYLRLSLLKEHLALLYSIIENVKSLLLQIGRHFNLIPARTLGRREARFPGERALRVGSGNVEKEEKDREKDKKGCNVTKKVAPL